MRIRKMKFCDYGIDEEEKNVLMELAKREENAVFIRNAYMTCPPPGGEAANGLRASVPVSHGQYGIQ